MPTHFRAEKIKFTPDDLSRIKKWINAVIRKAKQEPGIIQFVFCNDNFLLQLNRQFLHHNTFTDIITFDYSAGEKISGEIYISVQRVRENAKKFKTDFNTELLRVIIHGVLHLLGFRDKTKKQKEKMRGAEDKYLKLFTAL